MYLRFAHGYHRTAIEITGCILPLSSFSPNRHEPSFILLAAFKQGIGLHPFTMLRSSSIDGGGTNHVCQVNSPFCGLITSRRAHSIRLNRGLKTGSVVLITP